MFGRRLKQSNISEYISKAYTSIFIPIVPHFVGYLVSRARPQDFIAGPLDSEHTTIRSLTAPEKQIKPPMLYREIP